MAVLIGPHRAECDKAQLVCCICRLVRQHPDDTCSFRRSATCPIPIECDHGRYVCPECDPCTCRKPEVDQIIIARVDATPPGGRLQVTDLVLSDAARKALTSDVESFDAA